MCDFKGPYVVRGNFFQKKKKTVFFFFDDLPQSLLYLRTNIAVASHAIKMYNIPIYFINTFYLCTYKYIVYVIVHAV